MLGDDNALAFQFVVGALNRDDTHLEINGKLPDRRDRLPFRPVTHGNPLLDLLHDLEIHRALVGLREGERSVHLYILSILST